MQLLGGGDKRLPNCLQCRAADAAERSDRMAPDMTLQQPDDLQVTLTHLRQATGSLSSVEVADDEVEREQSRWVERWLARVPVLATRVV
jgi:hypothetical protein